MIEGAPYLVFVIPLLGALITPITAKIHPKVRDFTAVILVFLSGVMALSMLPDVLSGYTAEISVLWMRVSPTTVIEAGVIVDPLSVFLALIATCIGALIMLYSLGYMKGDKSLTRYWFWMQLFIGGMVLLVMANNFLQLFVGWEIVGMCSYALIGFWYDKTEPSPVPDYEFEGQYNSYCGMKAFIVTRVGDIGLLSAILIIFAVSGTFNFHQLEAGGFGWMTTLVNLGILPIVLVLLFGGAIGKSAQFPLHVWLPEAMAGPTTVSALIHAAAMVKAGVYLVARVVPIFMAAAESGIVGVDVFFTTVAWIGAFTAFLAATMALVQTEIKKVLAYSTVSQLGYMFLALGVSGLIAESNVAYFAGLFHLLSHALFKALLFLGAGAVLHSVHSKDMRDMGGLRKDMKITFATFLVGAFSLSGIPPFMGFFSKELILDALWESGHVILFLVAVITALFTVFYSFRMVGLTFFGEKSAHIQKMESEGKHIHEAPAVMWVPLVILAAFSVIGGFLQPSIVQYFHLEHATEIPFLQIGVPTLATALVVIGGFVPAWWFYIARKDDPAKFTIKPLQTFLVNRWYIDAFYKKVFVVGTLKLGAGINYLENQFNRLNIVVGKGMSRVSRGFAKTQTGILSVNILGMLLGIVLFLLFLLYL